MNLGEEIVSEYLQHIKHCVFIQRQVLNTEVQGETDVIGLNPDKKELYVCEAALHLTTGLQYTKDNKPNNVAALFSKFSKDINHVKKHFPGYAIHVMLWSPIVKEARPKSKNNQMNDVRKLQQLIKAEFDIELELFINEYFSLALKELREFAASQTQELKSPVSRLFQTEEYLKKHTSGHRRNAS